MNSMAASAVFGHLQLSGKIASTLPPFIYGTAWKKDSTSSLVQLALQNGFTAIDTACQPKHYREDLVGDGIRKFLSSSSSNTKNLKRSDLFIQTKFTSLNGQDPNNIPYDAKANLTEQVKQSIKTSLRNLTTSDSESPYIDSLVLHSPLPTSNETLTVWRTLESYVPDTIHHLGLSNTNLSTLRSLHSHATIKPSIVQNRFYSSTDHDVALRRFCADHDIIYQSFWTLTGNPELLRSRVVMDAATSIECEPASALYCLVLGLGGTVVCNGTSSQMHMAQDWEAVEKVRELAENDTGRWKELMGEFRGLIGDTMA